MSDTPIEVLKIKSIESHPQADRLEIAKVLDTQFITGKGDFQAGDLCVYFPPDVLIPESVGECLGVANYLKHAVYPGDIQKTKCRISAIRLRGVASFGFGVSVMTAEMVMVAVIRAGVSVPVNLVEGGDLTHHFHGEKYQPPVKFISGGSMRQPEAFHKYTSIQHYYRYGSAIPAGTLVRITEKLHGTNARVGLVKDNGFEFMCGTHYRRVEKETKGRLSLYWLPLANMQEGPGPYKSKVAGMLQILSTTNQNVVVFGEIYGSGIQKMDYGCKKSFRVFDISINGEYLDWYDVKTSCQLFGVETVPLLYEGPFSPELVEKFSNGPTTLAYSEQIRCNFKGREGIVITPLMEQYSEVLNDRLILKAVSPDYYEAMG